MRLARALVFLDLLKRKVELLAELLLAHAEQQSAAAAHATTNMNIDGFGIVAVFGRPTRRRAGHSSP